MKDFPIHELTDFANGLGRGYMKAWKAYGIVGTLQDCPEILQDEMRLLSYIEGCLKMEGFTQQGCEAVALFLIDRMA